MKILVTGATGGLGSQFIELVRRKYPQWECAGLAKEQLDITAVGVTDTIRRIGPDVILHAAAMTNVNLCEIRPELAWKINVAGTRAVSSAAKITDARMIFISTDYVFDGNKKEPYREEDETNPLNVYGRTKVEGEEIVRKLDKSLIVRTSWLYGGAGRNFVSTMLNLAQKQSEVRVVTDQVGAPTSYPDLSEALAHVVEKNVEGVLHITNSGCCSWFEFAKAVFEEKNIKVDVIPVSSEEFKRAATRPSNSRFSSARFEGTTGYVMRSWRSALKYYIENGYNKCG